MARDIVNQFERAYRLWPILTRAAEQGTTVTYGEVRDQLGLPHVRPVRFILGTIQNYCLDHHKPPLTILVVGQKGHRPGKGFIAWNADNLDEGYRQVYAYAWDAEPNPFELAKTGTTPTELAQRLVANPDSAGEVYGLINNRGFAQVIFRQALLIAYGGKCAFCGLGVSAALQAAHIVPWSKATPAERVSPKNGLLLCATHHGLFDARNLTVGGDYVISCFVGADTSSAWGDEDRHVMIRLHGATLRLPANPKLCPSPDGFVRRAKLKDTGGGDGDAPGPASSE